MNKNEIRKKVLKKILAQREEFRVKKSRKIKEILFSQPFFLQAHTVMFYIAKDGEVDTRDMICDALKMGKKVVVPVTLVREKKIIPSWLKDFKKELGKGPFGIYQPKRQYIRKVMPKHIDVIIVPGVAFDPAGNRLGRGGGYFDRFLATFKAYNTPFIGLAFRFQLLKRLPVSAHDIPVTHLICA